MGLPESGSGPMTHTASIAINRHTISAHANAHPRSIGTGFWIASPVFPDAVRPDHLAIPAVETEHAVCLGDGMPSLDIGDRLRPQFPRLHVFAVELAREQPDLRLRESHHFLLTETVTCGFPRMAPVTAVPALSAADRPCRLSFGGCGFQ